MNKLAVLAGSLSILIIAFSSYIQGSAIGTILTLSFGGFYSGLSYWLKTFPDTEKVVEGFPLWTFYVALFHQALVLPLLSLVLFYSIDSWESWLNAPISPGSLAASVHHLINGYILKDFIIYDIDLAFISHHLVTIVGCSLCLLVPAGGGYVTANAIVAEVGSALWNYQAVYPSWFSTCVYVLLFQISNIIPTYLGHIFVDLPELEEHPNIRLPYRIMLYFLVLFRSAAWFLVIRDKLYCRRSENVKNKAACGNLDCGIRDDLNKDD